MIDYITLAIVKQYIKKMISSGEFGDGKSAYEIAVENGFVGTEKEWLASLAPTLGEDNHWYVNGQDVGAVDVEVATISAQQLQNLFK